MPKLAWDEDSIQKAANLWNEGLSASEVGEALGVSRNSIISLANRKKDIFRKKDHKACTRRAKYKSALVRREKPKPQGPAIVPNWKSVPSVRQTRPVAQKPLDQMISDWIEENGGPRRFERGFSGDWSFLRIKLEEMGWKLNKQANWYTLQAIGSSGSGRKMRREQVLDKIDAILIANGKQPFLLRDTLQAAE